MTKHPTLALCAASLLPEAGIPDWVHLLPAAGGTISTYDGRGPYRVTDPAAIIAASLHADTRDQGGLIIDENHATDLAGPLGLPSPARGRIVELEARPNGIWGRVDWSATGTALLSERAYRGISPVIHYRPDGSVLRIARASLVNYPNLRGLVALNAETQMDLKMLATALGLAETATMEEILAAIQALKMSKAEVETEVETALQSEIGSILGVSGDRQAILAAVRLASAGRGDLVALQSQVTAQAAELKAIREANARAAAESYIDGEIARKRMGLNAQNRGHFVALHMSQPETCRQLIAGMPLAGETHTAQLPVGAGGDLVALNAEAQGRILHDRAIAWRSEQAAKGIQVSLFDAITHVKKDIRL